MPTPETPSHAWWCGRPKTQVFSRSHTRSTALRNFLLCSEKILAVSALRDAGWVTGAGVAAGENPAFFGLTGSKDSRKILLTVDSK